MLVRVGGIVGDLNNICEPSLPQPEPATGGIDAMIEPPAGASGGKTLYDNYGIAGQFWAAHGLQCSDMTSLIGNNVAGMVFDGAKSLDRVTITVYQSAAGNSILAWLQNAVDKLISALGNAIYFPYLAPVVILGAMWLAWQGLIRKRATRTIEGTLWMVVAATAAIALIGRPPVHRRGHDGLRRHHPGAEHRVRQPARPNDSNCLPVAAGDPQSVTSSYAFTSGNGLVDKNANELWSVLVCKPWLWGELGTTAYAPPGSGTQTVVNTYGRQLLWSQAIAANETPSAALIQAKQATYTGISNAIQANDPAIYPLFQGNQWTTRLEIAFAAMFAAVVAGLLILLIALTLIVLKLGFLLLLVAGPFFLIIGTHPGFGRIIAIRWFEMLVGVLMKQVAVAITLSVLLYCYSLIMGTSDAVLPWALKILMIALVTVAVFIYRKPFQHLFSAVGYGAVGSHERAEYSLRQAGTTFRRSTLDAAAGAIPGMAAYRAARWSRRSPGSAAAAGGGTAARRGRGHVSRRVGDTPPGPGRVGATAGRGCGPMPRPPRADGDGRGRHGPQPRRRSGLPGPEHARDRQRRPHGTAPGPAAQDGPAAALGSAGSARGPRPERPAVPRAASGCGPRGHAGPGGSGPLQQPGPCLVRAPPGLRACARPAPRGPVVRHLRGRPGRDSSRGRSRDRAPSSGPASRPVAPAWPLSSWSGAGTRRGPDRAQQPGPARQSAARRGTSPAGGRPPTTERYQATAAYAVWLRPIRRK